MRTTLLAVAAMVAFVGIGPGVWVPVHAQETPAENTRIVTSLVALYRADRVTEDGMMIELAEAVERLNLQIRPAPPPAVSVEEGAVVFGPSPETYVPGVFSTRPATEIIEALKETGQLTVEAWISAANDTQDGPARIVSISHDASSRNMTLGQEKSAFVLRLRTSETNEQGTPPITTPENTVRPGELQHLAVTYDGHAAVFYVDGEAVSETTHFSGDTGIASLQNWDETMHLMLGNEFDGQRFWCGKIYLAAIYGDSLSSEQVQTNYAAGLPQSGEQTE
ncbi:MAG: LamG domain-containing protein [Armatimonadota bacterium]